MFLRLFYYTTKELLNRVDRLSVVLGDLLSLPALGNDGVGAAAPLVGSIARSGLSLPRLPLLKHGFCGGSAPILTTTFSLHV